jgi:hypothetical protein
MANEMQRISLVIEKALYIEIMERAAEQQRSLNQTAAMLMQEALDLKKTKKTIKGNKE